MSANYRFVPWVRSGIAAQSAGASGAHRSVPVTLEVNGADQVPMQVRLYGPGDVIGLDPRQVVRTEPAHLTNDFEPNYFPAVELDRPDLPWLFSPAQADPGETSPKGRLQPWLCLVVVRRQPGVTLSMDPRRPLPRLAINASARADRELPDPAQAWAWIHAQVVEDETDTASLSERLAADSVRNLARLVCPRRLEPRTAYLACLVPTYELGRKAGLGLPITAEDEADLGPAWQAGQTEAELPVYYHYEFTTGAGGDFESLVGRLRNRPLPGRVGARRMAVGELGFGLGGLRSVWLQGALRAATAPGTRIPESFRNGLRMLLNRRADRTPGDVPLLGPPIYGRWQAAIERVPGAGGDQEPGWLQALNLDPRHRAAAGFGTLIVQDQQEALVTEAWTQLADTRRANQEINRARLATEASLSIHAHLAALDAESLLQTAGPVHSRVRPSAQDTSTLSARLRADGLPAASASTALRRLARPRGPLPRRLRAPAAAAPIHRLYRAPLTPAPVPAPRTVGLAALEGSVARLEGVVEDPAIAGTTSAADLLAALRAQHRYLEATTALAATPRRPERQESELRATLEAHRSALLTALDPKVTISARIRARIQAVAPAEATGTQSARSGTEPAPPPGEALEPLLMPPPEFPRPMYEALRDLSQDLLLPGLEHVPPETVTLLETNPQFVEAFMVGLNHEMGRELLWRGYPSDQRGTAFTRFWDAAGGAEDKMQLPPIHQWPIAQPLGGNFAVDEEQDGRLVLLIRGELLRRYPGALIYAVPAASPTSLDEDPLKRKPPLFRGNLEPDVTFLGFNLRLDAARADPGWFFVIEQQATEPRFGLDVPEQLGLDPAALTAWSKLSWGHFAADQTALEDLSHLPLAGPLESQGVVLDGIAWGLNAAHMAAITLQPPARIAVHANALLPA